MTTRFTAELPGGETASTPRPPSRATSTDGIKPVPPASRAAGRVREVRRACPYISNDAEQIAEGKKVGRSTVLSTNPLGCRFYLAYPDYHAVAQITVRKYPSEVAAFNTVARTGGSSAQSTPGIGDGAVLYRTRFFPPDGGRDWACVFAKATTVVTVLTDATLSSVDARNVAVAIVGKF